MNTTNPVRTTQLQEQESKNDASRRNSKRNNSKKGTLIRKKSIRDPFNFSQNHNTDNYEIADKFMKKTQ